MALATRTVYMTDGTALRNVECDLRDGGVWVVSSDERNRTVWLFYPMHRIELVRRVN